MLSVFVSCSNGRGYRNTAQICVGKSQECEYYFPVIVNNLPCKTYNEMNCPIIMFENHNFSIRVQTVQLSLIIADKTMSFLATEQGWSVVLAETCPMLCCCNMKHLPSLQLWIFFTGFKTKHLKPLLSLYQYVHCSTIYPNTLC